MRKDLFGTRQGESKRDTDEGEKKLSRLLIQAFTAASQTHTHIHTLETKHRGTSLSCWRSRETTWRYNSRSEIKRIIGRIFISSQGLSFLTCVHHLLFLTTAFTQLVSLQAKKRNRMERTRRQEKGRQKKVQSLSLRSSAAQSFATLTHSILCLLSYVRKAYATIEDVVRKKSSTKLSSVQLRWSVSLVREKIKRSSGATAGRSIFVSSLLLFFYLREKKECVCRLLVVECVEEGDTHTHRMISIISSSPPLHVLLLRENGLELKIERLYFLTLSLFSLALFFQKRDREIYLCINSALNFCHLKGGRKEWKEGLGGKRTGQKERRERERERRREKGWRKVDGAWTLDKKIQLPFCCFESHDIFSLHKSGMGCERQIGAREPAAVGIRRS